MELIIDINKIFDLYYHNSTIKFANHFSSLLWNYLTFIESFNSEYDLTNLSYRIFNDKINELLLEIIKIFPFFNFFFRNNGNISEILINLIYNILIINNIQREKYLENIEIKVKIFFLDNSKDILIDYNNIYLQINCGKIIKNYKLYYKRKKDNTISIRTANIINKYLFLHIYEIINKFLINNKIKILEKGSRAQEEYYFKNINILDIINEVRPSKYFFKSKLKPNIKYNKVKDENYFSNQKKYIELDYNNMHNNIEEINLFEKKWLNNQFKKKKKEDKEFILIW